MSGGLGVEGKDGIRDFCMSRGLGDVFFFFKQKTAYEIMPSLVGSEMCIRDRCSPDSSEVRELVSEYGFLMKQLSQIKKEHGLMVAQAQYYRNEKIKPMIDEKYGNGTAEFFAQAFEAFYKDK